MAEQNIDTLAISIESKVSGGDKLQKFADSMTSLAYASKRVDTAGMSSLANSLSKFSHLDLGKNSKDVASLARAVARLGELKSVKTNTLDTLASSLQKMANVKVDNNNLSKLANSMRDLANSNIGKFDHGSFSKLASELRSFADSMSEVGDINTRTAKVVSSITTLSKSGDKIDKVVAELPKLGKGLIKLVNDLSSVGKVDSALARLVSGIASLANAGKKAEATTAYLDKFGDAVVSLVRKLQGVGTIDTNLANTIRGLGALAQSGQKFSVSADKSASSTFKLTKALSALGKVGHVANSAFRSLISHFHKTTKTTSELASKIGMFYAKYFLVLRAIRGIGNITGSAQDYLEAFNYFNVALQKIGKDSKDQYKRFGYDNAEAYADSFQDRFKSLQKQMTGFDINSRTGEMSYKAGKSLGLNASDIMQYQAQIAQITNSTGQLGEVSVMASKAMSMLSADFSSLTNTDLTQVQENFMSALNGQTRAVYKYGVNLTSASLQQIAYNHGISESVTKMSMATKQQLRLIGMLEQSKVAWGDLAKTINMPANQLRMLKAGFSNLARTIGSIFLPALQAIYPVLNGIVMVLQEFFGWIAKLVGAEMPDMSSALKLPEMEEPADDMGNLADNTDKASKKAKKLSDNLQGFDEINKLDAKVSSDSDSPLGAKGIKDFDLSNDLAKLMDQYQKVWDKMFNSSKNKAYKWAQRIKKALLDGWKNGGDFSKLGKDFGKWLTKNLAKIPWAKIQSGVNKVSKSFATFIDGTIKGADWAVLGHTVAEFFNTIVGAIDTFISNIDFLNAGESFAKGINALINDFDWRKFGGMLGKKLRAMIQFAFGFVNKFDFGNAINKIFEGVDGFFERMNAVDSRTGLNGWQEFEKGLAKAVNSLVETFRSIYSKIDFLDLGKKIAGGLSDLINDIDWVNLGNALGEKIRKWIQLAFGFITNIDFENLASKITDSINSFLKRMGEIDPETGLSGWAEAGSAVSKGAKGILDGMLHILDNVDWDAVAKGISDFLGSIDWVGIFLKLGHVIAKALWTAIKVGFKSFMNDPVGVGSAIITVLGGLFAFNKLKGLIGIIKASFGRIFGIGLKQGLAQGVAQAGLGGGIGGTGGVGLFGGLASKLKKGFVGIGKGLKTAGSRVVDNFKAGLATGGGLKGALGNAVKTVGSVAKGGIGSAIGKASTVTGAVPVVGALATAYAGGKIIGGMYGDLIDAKTQQRESANKAGKAQGQAIMATSTKGGRDLSNIEDTYKKKMNVLKALEYKYNKELVDASPLDYVFNNDKIDKTVDNLNKVRGAMTGLNNAYAGMKMEKNAQEDKQVADARGQAIKKLTKLAENGKISYYELAKATAVVRKSTGDANAIYGQAVTATDAYQNATKRLSTDMTNSNVPMAQQKSIMDKLKTALGNGTISLQKYQQIVKSSKGDVNKLNEAIRKIPVRKDITVNFGSSGFDTISKYLNSIPRTIPVNVQVNGAGGRQISNQEYRSRTAVSGVIGYSDYENNMRKKNIQIGNDGTVKLKKFLYEQYKKNGKLKSLRNAGYKVKSFKQGGFIEDGIFTMNHNELAGKFSNGKSVVANNEQISEGFAKAITASLAPAIYSAVKSAMSEAGGGDQAVKVYLDGKQIADNSVKYIRQMQRSNGAKVFA